MAEHSTGPDEVQRRLQDTTRENTGWTVVMQIGDDQAVLMEIIAAMGAQQAVEVGTFTGYSALAVARHGARGHLLCCDVSEEWTAMARRVGGDGDPPIASTSHRPGDRHPLRALPPDEQFDLAFIDADKTKAAPSTARRSCRRLRPGGLILLDQHAPGRALLDPSSDDESVTAIRDLNDAIVRDERVRVVLLPIGDGVSVVQKR